MNGSTTISLMSFRLSLLLIIVLFSHYTNAAARHRLYYTFGGVNDDSSAAGLRVPKQDDLQSLVSQLLTRVNENNSDALQVRKQMFSRKFWKR